MPDFEERLQKLEDAVRVLGQDPASDLRKSVGVQAQIMALVQFMGELAARAGVDAEQFDSRFAGAFRWHQDQFLKTIAQNDKNLAGQTDDRDLGDVPTGTHPPSLFGEQ